MGLCKKFAASAATAALAFGLTQSADAVDESRLSTSWTVALAPKPLQPLAIDPFYAAGGMAALALLLALRGRGRLQGTWLRAGAAGVLATAIANPEIIKTDHEQQPSEIVIIADKTASQSLGGRDILTQAAAQKLAAQLGDKSDIRVRLVEVSGVAEGTGIDGTYLFGALETALTDIPRDRLGAVVMITDGQVHDAPRDLGPWAQGYPVHVLLSGTQNEFDRRIVVEQSPAYATTGESQTITFKLIDEGKMPSGGGKVKVDINIDGQKVQSVFAQPGKSEDVKITLGHSGTNYIEIVTAPLKGELTDVNNRAVSMMEGLREKMNVLLISGRPNPSFRMLRDTLKADPATNLVHISTLRLPGTRDKTPVEELALYPFSMNEVFDPDKLEKFDLVIFDHYENYYVILPSFLENISARVKAGGALLVIAGPEYEGNLSLYKTPLKSVLNVVPNGQLDEAYYKPSLSDKGRRHPVTRDMQDEKGKDMPWGSWSRQAGGEVKAGTVIMEGLDKKPLLALNREDKGRVAMLMSDSLWLWKAGFEGGGPYNQLLANVSQWLLKNPALEEEFLALRQQNNEVIATRYTMEDKVPSVTLRTPSGKTHKLAPRQEKPGLWQARLGSQELGLYSAEQMTSDKRILKTFINVGPEHPRELQNPLATEALLKPLADKTGGYMGRLGGTAAEPVLPRFEAAQAGQGFASKDWMGWRQTEIRQVKSVERMPVLPPLAAFILSLGMLATAYARESGFSFRKKGGAARTP